MASEVNVAISVEPLTVTVWPLGFAVTSYPVIAEPPVDDGGLQLTMACVLPAAAVTLVGAFGTVAGVTALEADDAVLLPLVLVATTVNV